MGKLEREIKAKDRRVKLQAIVLDMLYAAGTLSLAVLAPNALSILKGIDGGKYRKKNPRYALRRAAHRLTEMGLVQFKRHDGKTILELTEAGKRKVALLHAHKILLKRPKRWDGRWRIVIFDINERRKNIRNQLRSTLTNIGFVRLQDSVWVYPYECEDLITLLKADFKIGKDILYIIADKIEYDNALRKYFNV